MRKLTLMGVMGIFLPILSLQAQTIMGRVISSMGDALPNTTLQLQKNTTIKATDDKGFFSILITQEDTLSVSHVGYHTQILPVTNKDTFLTIQLSAISDLDEVVVSTGYQQIPKERAAGSFVIVDSTLMNRRASTNILDRLEGIAPGILFNKNTTASTSGPDISIRGTSTLFASMSPLIVVDGFPYDGDISNINPNDIKSITVLKDAAAASIWGVKSGNGVIVLTTRNGKRNSPMGILFNSNITIGNKPSVFYDPNFLDSKSFINVEKKLFDKQFYEASVQDPLQVISPVNQALYAEQLRILSSERTSNILDSLSRLDVRKDISKYYYRRSVSQQYSLAMDGGGDRYAYRFSVGYDQNALSLIGNTNRRTTISLANSFYPIKNLEIHSNIYFINENATENSTLSDLNVGAATNGLYPYISLLNASGNPSYIEHDYNRSFLNTASATGKYTGWNYYPIKELAYADNTSNNLDNRIVLGIKYKVISGIDISVNYQMEKQLSKSNRYFNDSTYYVRNLYNMFNDTTSGINPIPMGGVLNFQQTDLLSHRIRALVSFNRDIFHTSHLSGLLGAEVSNTRTTRRGNTAYGYEKTTESNINVDLSNYYPINPSGVYGLLPNINGFSGYADRYVSYFSNAAYTLQSKYIFSASGRIDKSNLFGVKTNQKSVPLYSAGFAWELSKESFYHVDWLSFLKLRVTYGYNGNVNKSVAAVTTLQQINNSYYSGYPYASILNPNNPQLQWEKIKMINWGIDFSTKSGIVSGSLEYYHKRGLNLLGYSPLAASTGLTQFMGNTASTKGDGVDVQLTFTPIKGHSFFWQSILNYSYSLDKVSSYDVESSASNYLFYGSGNGGTITPFVGKPIFSVFAYRWAGLDPNTGDPQGYLNGNVSKDYNAIISGTSMDSLLFMGSSRPTSYGSVINTFIYGPVSLSFNILYKLGYYFRRSSINYSSLFYSMKGNRDFTKRWQSPGDEQHTSIPSMPELPLDANRDNFYQYAEVLATKGDHLRLQDINISVQLPVSKKFFKSAIFYCYINNVGILWKANHYGLDPDTYSNGLPNPRTYALGLKLSL